jgi:hypothetical protein
VKLIEFDNEKMKQLNLFYENSDGLDLDKYAKRVLDLRSMILKSKNGCPRINFVKDLGMMGESEAHQAKTRLKKLWDDLDTKNDLCRNIYKFEKQMFILQGKINGTIGDAAELKEAVLQKDIRATKRHFMVDLDQDPNHRLIKYKKYQN